MSTKYTIYSTLKGGKPTVVGICDNFDNIDAIVREYSTAQLLNSDVDFFRDVGIYVVERDES